jgi:hypothetical protein
MTAILSDPATLPGSGQAARVSFRQPVSTAGFIDGAWWPRTLDLATELPPLLDVLWSAAREITRVSYHLGSWEPVPIRLMVESRSVRLGGFQVQSPLLLSLRDSSGRERIDLLVIAPDTDPATAERALDLASQADQPLRAAELLQRAQVA